MRFDLCFFCELFQTEFFADFLCYVLAEALADVRYATCYIHDVNIFALIAHSFNGINDFLCDFAHLVGRSSLQSYCVLQSTDLSEKAMQRLGAMVRTTNGFEIAEEDLKIRGAGDFLGTRQSGENKYMALMLAYPDKYKYAQTLANRILDDRKKCPILTKVLAEQEDESGE